MPDKQNSLSPHLARHGFVLQSIPGSSSAVAAPGLAAEEAAGSSAAQVAAPRRVRWAEGADLEQVVVFQVSCKSTVMHYRLLDARLASVHM